MADFQGPESFRVRSAGAEVRNGGHRSRSGAQQQETETESISLAPSWIQANLDASNA